MSKTQSGKRGGRKIGRNKAKCETYRKENRREKNQIRRLVKRLRHFKRNEGKSLAEIKAEAYTLLNL